MSNKRPIAILLVEDDEIDQLTMKRMLLKSKLQHTLDIKEDGLQAIEFLKENYENLKIDLVLTDINMPVMDGIELVKEIRQINKFESLPVFAQTTSSDDHIRLSGMSIGFTNYILKPIDVNDFIDAINKIPLLKDRIVIEN